MSTTIKQIANRLGISISTVSKGLNGASDISDELRQMVLDTAIEMGYKTKRMKKESNKRLCIFIENMEYDTVNQFGYEIVLGFKQMAQRDNWEVTLIPTNPNLQSMERYDSFMLKHGFSASFFVGFALQDDWITQLSKTTFPTVLLDNYIEKNPCIGYVGTDSYEGIALAVDHLVKLGHRKIAFFSGSPNSMVTSQRYEAYMDRMAHHGLVVEDDMVAFGYYVTESAKFNIPDLLSSGATAIICGSDLMAAGAVQECVQRGYHVPEDISIIGFDDLPISSFMNPPLTTVRQDRINIGKSAYYVLSSLMNHVAISRANLRAILIQRGSTGPCKITDVKNEKTDSDAGF